jgi:hypothetical protein
VGYSPFQVKIQRGKEKKERVTERETDIAERRRNKSGDRGWRLKEMKVQ